MQGKKSAELTQEEMQSAQGGRDSGRPTPAEVQFDGKMISCPKGDDGLNPITTDPLGGGTPA